MTAVLALSFVIGGILLAILVYIAMIIAGEFLLKPNHNDD
jgi:hypothetical protein